MLHTIAQSSRGVCKDWCFLVAITTKALLVMTKQKLAFIYAHKRPFALPGGDKVEPFIKNVSIVQLVLEVKKEGGSRYASLEPYIGDLVSCSGSLYAAHTGHHHAPILMWATLCRTPPGNKAFKADATDGARP